MIKLPLLEKEAYLITDELTRKYLSGITLDEGMILYSKTPIYFADARYFSVVKTKMLEKGFTPKLYTGLECVKEVLKSYKIKKLYIDFDKVSITDYADYKKLGVKILDGSKALKQARAVKEEFELENIKTACKIAQNAIQDIIQDIKEGVSENYIKEKLEKTMLYMGAESTSFDTIVAFGANSAVPHHQTGETKLKKNSVVLIDMGCKVNGYCSDITRTYFYGEPKDKFIECYNAVLKANQTAIDNITNGMTTDQADGCAREILKDNGLDKFFTHSLGHGIGLEIHEFPFLSSKRSDKLENRMVFTIEPGVYFESEFGIRIEDTVVLEDGKVKRLYSDDKKLKILK